VVTGLGRSGLFIRPVTQSLTTAVGGLLPLGSSPTVRYSCLFSFCPADAMRFELTGEFLKRGFEPIPLREILMLTGFYVPELKSELKKIQDLCTVFSELLLEWMDAHDVPEQRKKAAGKLILWAGEITAQAISVTLLPSAAVRRYSAYDQWRSPQFQHRTV
jgi:hypothetical protein